VDATRVVVTWSRGWAVFALVAAGGLATVALGMAAAAGVGLGGGLLTLLGAVLALAALRSARLAASPPVMFEASAQGVTTYLEGDRYRGRGFTVPWSQVTRMERRTGSEQPGNLRVDTIELQLTREVARPPGVSYRDDGDPRVLRLDAVTGSLRGERLLEALRRVQVRARRGPH
jgi:hypothetical protein